MTAESAIENLVLAIEAAGFPEATAAVGELKGAIGGLTEATAALNAEMAAGAAGGGAAAAKRGGRGLIPSLTSFKTLLAGLGVYEAVKQFSTFQASMERIHTQAGATQAEVGRMSKAILDSAKELGTTPIHLAESMYHIQSVGLRGKEAVDAMKIAAQGAKVGIANLTETTNAMTAVVVAGFRGTKTLSAAMGELNATVGAGDMTFENLNEALGTGFLATMKASGLEVRDVGAALAVLGDNNIRGAEAATKLRMSVTQLAKEAAPARDVLKELGIGPLQLAEDLHKPEGLLAMLRDLEKHFAAVGLAPGQGAHKETVRAHDIFTIFGGGRNALALTTLLQQMPRLEEKYGRVHEGAKTFAQDWEKATQNLQFFIDELKALVDVWLIKLGSALNDTVHWFQKNQWAVEVLKGAIIAFTSALVIGRITAFAGAIRTMFGTMIAGGTAAEAGAAGKALGLTFGTAFAAAAAVYIGVKLGEWLNHHFPKGLFPNGPASQNKTQNEWQNILMGRPAHWHVRSFGGHQEATPLGSSKGAGWNSPEGRLQNRVSYKEAQEHLQMFRSMEHEVFDPATGRTYLPNPGEHIPLPTGTPVILKIDGKVLAKAIIRQGLIAQSRRGHGH